LLVVPVDHVSISHGRLEAERVVLLERQRIWHNSSRRFPLYNQNPTPYSIPILSVAEAG